MAAKPEISEAPMGLLERKRDEWIQIGLDTRRMDRAAARAGIEAGYREAGKEPPRIWIYLDGPLHGAIASGLLGSNQVRDQVLDQVSDQVRVQVSDQVLAQVSDQVSDQVRDQVRDQVLAQVSDQVSAQVRDQVLAQVSDQVRVQVSDQVLAQVSDQVSDQVRDQVRDQVLAQVRVQVLDQVSDQVLAQVRVQVSDQVRVQVSDQVRVQVSDQVLAQWHWPNAGGQHDAGWGWGYFSHLCWYDTMRELGVREAERAAGWYQLARSAGWCWMYWTVAIITDRPLCIHRDAQNRLHRADGPAMAYADGLQIWCWHGIRTTERVIMGQFSADEIDKEPNAEIRRCMTEKFTAERYLRETNAQLIAADEYGKLWRKPQAGDEDLVMVEVRNSTPEPDGSIKDYWLRVPPTMSSPRQAIAWTFSIDKAADYKPAVET